MATVQFDFYGVGVHIKSSEEEFNRSLENDFSYFLWSLFNPTSM